MIVRREVWVRRATRRAHGAMCFFVNVAPALAPDAGPNLGRCSCS